MSPNKIFMFLITPPCGNANIQKLIAKHVFECFKKKKEKRKTAKSKYSRTGQEFSLFVTLVIWYNTPKKTSMYVCLYACMDPRPRGISVALGGGLSSDKQILL